MSTNLPTFFVKYSIDLGGFRDTRCERIQAASKEAVCTMIRENYGDNTKIITCYLIKPADALAAA